MELERNVRVFKQKEGVKEQAAPSMSSDLLSKVFTKKGRKE